MKYFYKLLSGAACCLAISLASPALAQDAKSAETTAGATLEYVFDSTTSKVSYTDVVTLSGQSKDQVYDKVYEACKLKIKPFNAAAIAKNDKATGILEVRVSQYLSIPDPKTGMPSREVNPVKYKLKFYFKEGRFKYIADDFHYDKGGYKLPFEKFITNDPSVSKSDPEGHTAAFKVAMSEFLTDLVATITAEKPEAAKDDW